MKSLRTISIALVATANCACSGASPSSMAEDERIETVNAALAYPTEVISPASARAFLPEWLSFERVRAAFEAILLVGSDAGKPCLSGSPAAGAYELGCLTSRRVQGRITFESSQFTTTTDAGLGGQVKVALQNACIGDACVNGDVVMDVAPSDCAALATLAVTATVSHAGEDTSLSFGVQGGIGRNTFVEQVVYFDAAGRSLRVDGAGALDSPGPYLLSGADRSFECYFRGGGGRCDGATSFTF